MTGAARVWPQRLDVTLMREMRVPREIMDSDPLDRFLVGPRLANLLDFRLMGTVTPTDDEVASHAGLQRGDPGLGRYRDRVVAVLALNLVLPGVNIVAKEDRLARASQTRGVGGLEERSPGGVGG